MAEMTQPIDQEHFERVLHGMHGRILGDLGRLEEQSLSPADRDRRTVEDQSDGAAERDVDLEILEEQDELVREIVAALHRIEDGSFGRCERCGDWIQRERLEALPYARRCIACAGVDA